MQKFDFAILGAGAMGSILGAHLARAGHSVALLARGRRAEHVRSEGLRISGLAQFSTPIHVIDDPARLRETQVLVVATKAIGTADEQGGQVDLRRLAGGGWDRVLVVAPGTDRDLVSEALGSEYKGDLPFGSQGQLFVFARGSNLVRFADYRGRATFTGFERPLDTVPRAGAVLAVRDLVVSPAMP